MEGRPLSDKGVRRSSINNIHCMYASQRSTGICSMLYPRVIWAVSVTPWTIILVGVKFLTFQPKAEHIRTGILFIEDPFSRDKEFCELKILEKKGILQDRLQNLMLNEQNIARILNPIPMFEKKLTIFCRRRWSLWATYAMLFSGISWSQFLYSTIRRRPPETIGNLSRVLPLLDRQLTQPPYLLLIHGFSTNPFFLEKRLHFMGAHNFVGCFASSRIAGNSLTCLAASPLSLSW